MAPAADLGLGTILSNTYRITGKLGEGGMGSVYRAEHQRLPRPYAIKVLHEAVEPDSEFYHRFRREAEICSRLQHENIVEVVDFNFTPDGRPYIAMELLDGEDLESRLEREGRLSEAQTLEIVRQVASGLAEAHEQGVVHRDLKPQNIFLCKRRQGGDLVKIVDFGISKIQGSVSVLTAAFTLVGTPHYMSPEQTGAGDGRVTARSDIYALGVIAYQMLSGEMPIVGDSLAKIVMSINTQRPRPLRELVPGLSPAVEAVVDVSLAKDPLRRFASVTDFHEALRRAVEIGDLMGISPHDSVAATVAAGGGHAPPGSGVSPAVGESTTAYDQRAFRTPSQSVAGTAPVTGAEYMAPPVHPPMPGGPGSLAAAAVAVVQSDHTTGGEPHSATVLERPLAADGAGNAGATPGAGAPVSKTTLSSAAAEAPPSVPLPRPASSRLKVVALVVAVVVLFGGGAWWYMLGGRSGQSRSGGGGGGSDQAGAAGPTTGSPLARPMERPRVVPVEPGGARVVIRLKGLPAGASCLVAGEAVEGNPLVLRRRSAPVPLTCRAPGHQARTEQLVADRDQTVNVTLERLPGAVTAPGRPRPRAMGPRRPRPRARPRAMRPVMRRGARPIDSDIPIE